MDNTIHCGTRTLTQNFEHWTFHVGLCSAPSFYIAYSEGLDELHHVAAMGTGILIFIILYTLLTSSRYFQKVSNNSIRSKAFRWATKLRTSISVIGGLGIFLGKVIYPIKEAVWVLFAPDLFSGAAALYIVKSAGRSWPLRTVRNSLLGNDPSIRSKDIWMGDMDSFFPILGTVLVEGLIISFTLLIFCITIAIALNIYRKARNSHIDYPSH